MSVTIPRAIRLCDLLDCLLRPILNSLPLVSAHLMFWRMVQAHAYTTTSGLEQNRAYPSDQKEKGTIAGPNRCEWDSCPAFARG
jgi:hypothetical protein